MLQNIMRLRFPVNPLKNKVGVYYFSLQENESCAHLNFLWIKSLIYESPLLFRCLYLSQPLSLISSPAIFSLISCPVLISGYMELYPRRSHWHEEESAWAGLQSSSQHAALAQICQVHRIVITQTQHCPPTTQHPRHDVRQRYSTSLTCSVSQTDGFFLHFVTLKPQLQCLFLI